MRFFKVYFIIGSILILGLAGYWLWQSFFYLDPQAPETYYKIFNKAEILSGEEETANEVIEKLDKRLAEYQKTFAKMAGTNDETKLRALFYLNFVHMSAPYGQRELQELSLKELLWGGDFFQCGNYATLLAILLDKSGYQYRTLAIYPGHGIVEVMLDGRWQVLDPTTNIWIDQSIEAQVAGDPKNIKEFFLQAEDTKNTRARDHLNDPKIKVNVVDLKNNFMKKVSPGGPVRVGQYNYINLSNYQY